MSSVNMQILVGNLGKDPEVRYMPNGDAVCNFTVATSDRWRDKQSGEDREETQWHRCVAFARLGEVCGEYLKKGTKVYIAGKTKHRKYTDKDGVDRYTTEITVEEMKMLSSRQDSEGQQSRPAARQQPERQQPERQAPARQAAPSGFDDMDDDIPF